MKNFGTLTVGQSMASVFLAGLAVLLFFAAGTLLGDLELRGKHAQDRVRLGDAQEIGALVHALQRERGLTTAWLAAPGEGLAREIAAQRLRVDQVLAGATRPGSGGERRLGTAASPIDDAALAAWLAEARAQADARRTGPRAYRDGMTAQTTRLVAAVARGAEDAHSVQVALTMRTVAALMTAKDAVGLERAIGATILGQRETGRTPAAEDRAELQDQGVIRRARLATFRAIADADSRSFLDLWERSRAVRRYEAARRALMAPAPAGPDIALSDWMAGADRVMDALRALELEATGRHFGTLDAEIAAARADALRQLGLAAALIAVLGALAAWTTRRVDRSIRGLIMTVCRLSIDPRTARIEACPQKDLDQIASGLSILRAAQIEQMRAVEAAERLRSSVDEELDRVFGAVEAGAVDRRVDVLGLDAHGAVLARGVNRLLDQMERDRAVSAS